MQKNLTIVFKDGGYKVIHNDKGFIMTTKISSNRMLVVFAPMIMSMFLKVTTEDGTQSRHYIYGHLSFKGIGALIKKDMVKGMHSLKELDETCFDCLMEKPHRKIHIEAYIVDNRNKA